MTDLTNIFPTNYPDRPSTDELECLFKDILNRADSVNSVVATIEKESCPYYKLALVHLLARRLNEWYDTQAPMAGYHCSNGWIPYWQEPNCKIRELIRKYEAQQPTANYTTTLKQAPKEVVEQLTKSVKQAINAITQTIQQPSTQPLATAPLTIHNTINIHFHIAGDMVENHGTLNKNHL
jgi:hypothetical protein